MAKTDKNATSEEKLSGLEQAIELTEAEMRERYPYLAAAIEKARALGDKMPVGLRVRAKADGYRRGGFKFSTAPTDLALPGPDTAQLEAIFADKELLTEFVFASD